MKKLVILTLILLSTINLVHAQEEVYNSTEHGIITHSEIKQFIEAYLRTYYTLVEIQKEDNKDFFVLYNKTFLIIAIVSKKGEVEYAFKETNKDTSQLVVYQTNEITDIIPFKIKYSKSYLLRNITINGELYNYLTQIYDFESINTELAESEAYHNFLFEYRALIVQKAIRVAEKNPSLNPIVEKLVNQKELMDKGEREGIYKGVDGFQLYITDKRLFDKLASEIGINEEEAQGYMGLKFPEKEIIGIPYENNLFYSILFSFLFIVSLFLSRILGFLSRILAKKGILGSILKKLYLKKELLDKLSPLPILYWLVSAKPYDYSPIQAIPPILVLVIGLIILSRGNKENKVL